MTQGTIRCPDMGTFMKVIAGLVEHGLTYEADADTLTITTTGGF